MVNLPVPIALIHVEGTELNDAWYKYSASFVRDAYEYTLVIGSFERLIAIGTGLVWYGLCPSLCSIFVM